MYSITNLFSAHYWFSYVEPINTLSFWIMFVLFSLMVIGAIVLYIVSGMKKIDKPLRRGLRKIARVCVWMGLLGFMLLFFRYELVYLLSRRILLAVWVIGFLVWVFFIVKYFVTAMPRQRKEIEEANRLKKYLP